MGDETTQETKATYYWASWRRAATVALPCGIAIFILSCATGSRTFAKLALYAALASLVGSLVFTFLGMTFVRVKKTRLHFQNGTLFWTSTDVANIQEIMVAPRFWFTNKATLVLMKYKKGGGILGGSGLSRDMFSDTTIATLISHLKRLNPTISLDEGIEEILRSQGRWE